MISPARKFKPSAVKNLCTFPSTKLIPGEVHQIRVESIMEKDYCYYLQFNPAVKTYQPQPETFRFPDPDALDNKHFKYTPDFLVTYHDGRMEYVEVKPLEIRLKEQYRRKINAFETLANRLGYGFEVVDRTFIYHEPLLKNYKFLYRYLNRSIDTQQVINSLKANFPSGEKLSALLNSVPQDQLKAVYAAVAHGELNFDLSKTPIHENPEVTYA